MKRTTSKKTATKSTDKSRVFSSATKSSSKKGQHPSQYHPASPSSGAGRPMTSSKSTKQSLVSQSRSGKKNSIHDHDSNSKRKYLQNFGGESNATSSLLSMKSAASNHKKKRKTSIPSDANALFSQNQGGSGITDPTNARIGLLPLELDSSNSMPATVSSDGTCCCLGCSLPRCGKCTLCEQSGFLYNTCVFKTCHVNRDNDEEIRNFNEIKSILEERDFLEVGSRVYAAWNKDDPKSGWYWGAITKQYFMKRNFSNAMNEYYSITFDDGDKKCNVDREEIWSEFKYKLLTEKVRLENLVPPIDNTDNEKKEESETMVSTPKLPIANAVDPVIKSNQDAAVMKQKPTDTTSQGQDMNGNSSGNHIDGRTNINANGGTLQQRGNTSSTLVNKPSSEKNDSVRKSLAHVVMGSSISRINTVNTSSSETKVTALKKSAARKLGVDEWWKRGCLRCTNCKREKCHKCAMCLSAASTNKDSDDDIEKWMPFRCYQKMCLKVPEGEKLQKTPYFPDGWKFGFTTVASRNVQWNGFLLVAPPSDGEQRFRSIGRAIKQMHLLKLQDLANNAKLFYQHVGLDGVPDTKLEALSNETIDGAGSIGKPPDQPSDGKDLQGCGPTSIEISHDLRSSSHREQSVRKQHVYSTKKELGARVYAKFSNDEWYWGMVTKVIHGNPIAGFPKFSIQYDDGEAIHNLGDEHVVSEQEYFDISKIPPPTPPSMGTDYADSSSDCSFPDAGERVSFSLTELFQLRCKSCSSCLKKDCDKCLSCKYNKLSTSRERQVCYFNMCERIPHGEKAQPVPGLPLGWNFYISGGSMNDILAKNSKSFHPDLIGLHIIPPDGRKTYRSMEDAIKDCKFNKHESEEKIGQFYEQLLGIRPRRERSNHQLIGHGYHREWVDGTGRHREVYGTIAACWESLFVHNGVPDLFFSVRYDDEIRKVLNSTSMCQLAVPDIDDNVPEHVAYGGFLSFSNKVERSTLTAIDQMILRTAPFHFKWIVPTMRYYQQSNDSEFKSLVLITKGYKLELEAKPSSIPNSGLGLWIKCTAASSIVARNANYFELAPGESVDLGCYAPTDNIDRRPEHVNLVKAFIHMWDCESWCFEMVHHHRGTDVFDITDDLTGDLHDKSMHNIVVYANETDGLVAPTLFAEHDPEGSVHYYMGYREDINGTFRIPVDGEAIELKVDYGPKYENVRVRKGYSRLPVDEAARVYEKLKEDDAEVLGEIQEYSAKDLFDVIVFLENLVNASILASETKRLKCDKLVRALVVSIALHKRIAGILKEFSRPVSAIQSTVESNGKSGDGVNFCDNGFTDMRQKKAFERSRKLVLSMIHQFANAEQLKAAICSDQLYVSFVNERIGVDSIDSMEPQELQTKLLDMHKIETS